MTEGNFTDYAVIEVQSGKGGMGSSHLRREKYVPKGGPDGGDGGNGGNIIIRGNKQLWTLYHFKHKKHFKSENGGDGSKSRSQGKNGTNVYIEVPLGTIIKENGLILYEIIHNDEEYIIAKGGKGGLGNWHFKSAVRQTPRYRQSGLPGVSKKLVLELKVLADVGLVGKPNVGKSTLLSVLTSAKPKIANYEFTTLKPNLGIVDYKGLYSFAIADIPGIIEGAVQGKGLGLRFLRHIERNVLLTFLIAADSTENHFNEYQMLLNELTKYNQELLDKKKVIVISKSDLLSQRKKKEIEQDFSKNKIANILFISSLSNMGLEELKDRLWNQLNC